MAQTESMASPSVPCLVEKALSMLISMGCHGRPKTSRKLENVLRACTMVAPYVDPLKALEITNRRSEYLEPPVLNVQHNKTKVYYVSGHSKDEAFLTSVLNNAKESGRDYDFALPGSESYEVVTQKALAWLSEWETREGTQEQLEQGLFEHCQKKVDRSPLEIILRLQSRGFLNIEGGNVRYSLPHFDSNQSRVLEALRDGESKTIFQLCHIYQCLCGSDYNVMPSLLGSVYCIPDSRWDMFDKIEHWGRKGPCQSADGSISREGFEDLLRDILGAYSLSNLPPEDRPKNLNDLIHLMKSETLILAVPPSNILDNNLSQVKHRQVKPRQNQITNKRGNGGTRRRSRGGARRQRTEFVLGYALGETSAQELIPLTPEGLLGIHVTITTPSQIPKPDACINPGEDQTTPMDSPPTWLSGNKLRAKSLSKEFGAQLFEQLTRRAKNSNAVLVPASKLEKEETSSRVLQWLDALRPSSCHGNEDPRKLKSVKQLQRELISLCANRPRRIAPGTIVRCLQMNGYVIVHSGETPEISYKLPLVTPRPGSVSKDGSLAPWQQHAEDFRQSVSKCYTVYFERVFPRTSKPSTPQEIGMKGQRRGRACPRRNKKLKN